MTEKYQAQMQKIRQARILLLKDHPFWGDLAFGIPVIFDETLNPPTAATNGSKFFFHPDFVMGLPKEELVFVIAHEVIHAALMHVLRRGTRDPKGWNVACDIVDNYLLITNKVGKAPDWIIHDVDLYNRGGGKVEKIYDLLPEKGKCDQPGSGPMGGYGSMDALIDADPAEAENFAANMRNKLQQALQAAKNAGKCPGGLEEFVEQLTVPKVSWQNQLRNFMMVTRGNERTYSKRNRRYAALDVILPGHYGEKMGVIVEAIDCSGSTSNEMIAQGGAEISSVQEELRPEKIHVLYFDTQVQKHEEFEPDEPITVKAYGRGGTCFRTVFEYIEENGIAPECCIVMTDLDCHDYGPEPSYPVLWLAEDNAYARQLKSHVPWGQVLLVN